MKKFKTAAAFLLLAVATYLSGINVVTAQVPSHPPGSICATPQFWCWAQIWGTVGSSCYCDTAGGPVAGQFI